ncbi:deoxynucleoside kinase [Patescibacteria group bacterium]|nr:deoxynucleoside kinase [Patescibacteria group bacterium]MBU1931601.1 deoxynucleoside kinase [Patescibacteria group bacterium]
MNRLEVAGVVSLDSFLPPSIELALHEEAPVNVNADAFFESCFAMPHRPVPAEELRQGVVLAREHLPSQQLIEAAWHVWRLCGNGRTLQPIIFIEGVMSSGKSTLGEILANRMDGMFRREGFAFNVGLRQFYPSLREIANWRGDGAGLQRLYQRIQPVQAETQVAFANATLSRVVTGVIDAQFSPTVVDVLFSNAVFELVHRRLHLASQEHFEQYAQASRLRWSVMPPLSNSVIVYNAVCSPEEIMRRMAGRWGEDAARDFERDMPLGYVEHLIRASFELARFLQECAAFSPNVFFITVDAENVDYSSTNPAREELADALVRVINGVL